MLFEKKYDGKVDSKVVKDLMNAYSTTREVAELYYNRGLTSLEKAEKYFSCDKSELHNPYLFKNMKAIVDRISYHIDRKSSIVIFGDYDVDGVSATSILIKFFKSQGVFVKAFLPSRHEDGYGLTMNSADKVLSLYSPELIITVDCGISCHTEIDYLISKGVEVIVTDHHEAPEVLPNCLTLDAKVEGETYPYKELCGAAVAFKIVQAFLPMSEWETYLPVVAVATVSDLVSLTGENRILSKLGLESFFQFAPKGLIEFLKVLKINGDVSAIDVAFKLAPKINAAGRLGDAFEALKLYIYDDYEKIFSVIKTLQDMNANRQELCDKAYEQSVEMIESDENFIKNKAVVVMGEDFNSGILGIVAARLVDKYGKVAIVLAPDNEGVLRGSARSVDGISIINIFNEAKEHLVTYGGHEMAGGLGLRRESLEEFKKSVNHTLENLKKEGSVRKKKYYDLEMKKTDITKEFLAAIERLAPFGIDNEKPIIKTSLANIKMERMKNFPKFTSGYIKQNNLSIIDFSGGKHYNAMKNFIHKDGLIDISLQKYGKRENVSMNIKNISFKKLDNARLAARKEGDAYLIFRKAFGENLDVLVAENINKAGVIELITANQDVLMISSNINAALDRKINDSIEEIGYANLPNGGERVSLVYNISDKNLLLKYKNIIVLDEVDEFYIANIAAIAKKKIYIMNAIKKVKKCLSRDIVANYYKAILKSTDNIIIESEFDFFNNVIKQAMTGINGISYKDFILSLMVLEELNIVNMTEDNGRKTLSINKNEKVSLENSKVFNAYKI